MRTVDLDGPGRLDSCPGAPETLAAVQETIADAVSDVHEQWVRALGDGGDDILGAEDLPTWLRRVTVGGGKQIRPLMCHWGFVAAGGERSDAHADAVHAGAALELLHVFALLHDDVMDESATRRGAPAAHVLAARAHRRSGAYGAAHRYGESVAILLGDLAHAMADALVATLPPAVRRLWFELNIELIAGQREDLSGAATGAGGLERATRIASLKSGAYTITRPLQLGALCASGSPRVVAALSEFGAEVGRVFAARDDILGVWGNPAATGKPSGDDLVQRKPTTLWVDATQNLDAAGLVLLHRIGTPEAHPNDVAALQAAMEAAGVRERAEASIRTGVERATALLEQHTDLLAAPGITGLTEMAAQIAWRHS